MSGRRLFSPHTRGELAGRLFTYAVFGLFGLVLLLLAQARDGEQWKPRTFGAAFLFFAITATVLSIRAYVRWSRGERPLPRESGPRTVRGVYTDLAARIAIPIAFGSVFALSGKPWKFVFYLVVAAVALSAAISDAKQSLRRLREEDRR